MSKFTFFALAAVTTLLGTGCVHRELQSFVDHDSKPLTAIGARIDRSYLFWSSHEYVFYSCLEQGDTLQCKRLCGGSADIVCPEAVDNGSSVATNIR